jgi:hypothetical protein
VFSRTGIGVVDGVDGAFSWTGIDAGGVSGGFWSEALSWTGIGVVGDGDGAFSWTEIDARGVSGGFWSEALSWTGIGVVGAGDGRFLVGAFSRAIGCGPNLWKYKLQVVDSSMR